LSLPNAVLGALVADVVHLSGCGAAALNEIE
jgi:hypothetical protein